MAEPLTANEVLQDALIRHQVYLIRLAGGLRNRILLLLEQSEDPVAAAVREVLRDVNGQASASTVLRLERLLDTVSEVRGQSWASVQSELAQQLTELATAEPHFLNGMMALASPVLLETTMPSSTLLRSLVTTKPFEGVLLKEWVSQLEVADVRRMHAEIQRGIVEGSTTEEIVRRIVGSPNTGGVADLTAKQVDAMVKTSVAHFTSAARDIFAKLNSDVISREKIVATLDSRTTPICRARDGKTFPVGVGPRPPFHIRCRTVRIPLMDDEVLSTRPAKPSTERELLSEFTKDNNLPETRYRKDLPRGTKGEFDAFARKRIRELTGVVPENTNYNDWLGRQSTAFQNEVLGPTRAKLFRQGGLTLDRFVAADGTELTLEQLGQKYESAFKAAGVPLRH